MGANLGIQDGQNLAWKLAAVLQGYADSTLLRTSEGITHFCRIRSYLSTLRKQGVPMIFDIVSARPDGL